jgi:hypothetical protein
LCIFPWLANGLKVTHHSDRSLAEAVLTLILEVIRLLRWPMAIIVVIWLLRAPVLAFASRIRFRGFGFEVDIERELEGATEAPRMTASGLADTPFQAIMNRAAASPAKAILESWFLVEAKLKQAAANEELANSPPEQSLPRIMAILRRDLEVTQLTLDNVLRLWRIASAIAEGVAMQRPNAALAKRYVALAEAVYETFPEATNI